MSKRQKQEKVIVAELTQMLKREPTKKEIKLHKQGRPIPALSPYAKLSK